MITGLQVFTTLAAAPSSPDAASASIHDILHVGPVSITSVILVILSASMLCTLYRLLRGPTIADRVIALDLIAFFAAGAIAVLAVESQRSELLTVAIIVALLAFMGTAAFAMYLERRGRERVDKEDGRAD